jgi:hypothetical protein
MPGAHFDSVVWRKRAWNRFQHAIRSPNRQPAKGPENQWVCDLLHINHLDTVVLWAASKGITVLFAKREHGVYDPHNKVVTITARANPEKQLYYLLHECGHHLIGMEELHVRFGMGYPRGNDPAVNRTFHHKVSCLEEELEAWHRGWKLSQRLGLNLDRAAFDQVRLECIRTYVKWAARAGK